MAQTASAQQAKVLVPTELRLTVILSIAVAALAVAFLVTVFFLGSKKVLPVAVDNGGRVIPMVPLDQPYVTDTRVLGFVNECLRRSFSHDFENFRQTVNDAKACYTPRGAVEYEQAITPLLNDVREKNFVMSVSLEESVLANRYVQNGVATWVVETPMTLFRRGSRETIAPVRFLVTSIVIRAPLEHDVRGIAIRAINVRPFAGR